MEKGCGILLHISSLPSNFGIGDLGPSAYKFVDFLCQAKQKYWQILPLNPTDPMFGNSPYSSHSAFAGNPLFISPALLKEDGLLTDKEFRSKLEFDERTVDFSVVIDFKNRLLSMAYNRFKSSSKHKKLFKFFCQDHVEWLDNFALYVVLKNIYVDQSWNEWPDDIKSRQPAALDKVRSEKEDLFNRIRFEQYIFFQQWFKLKDYCREKNISIIGDIPIYVGWDSVDVWVNPELFKLLDDGRPEFVAGVPPDYFSATGQRWGNPVYNWEVLKKNQFEWWHKRIEQNFKCFDIVRIDHFRGLVAYWEIPEAEETAVNGHWSAVPVDDFMQSLKNKFGELPIIAEDLGIITDDVKDVMNRFQLPGMKILLFAFNGDLNSHPYLPHNFTDNCIVYTGTHDNNTALGWFEDEATEDEKNNLFNYVGNIMPSEIVPWALIELALKSIARIAMIPMQDVLLLKSDQRMNTPSTKDGNWGWRMSSGYLEQMDLKRLAGLVEKTKR
ncbi:MAG: 4-alpha-glucanotransferase [Candidatus Omnitrophica bacterium]|nr:4-alpha-glucanotransferase [Candidatus Omnitrophota bacterium]